MPIDKLRAQLQQLRRQLASPSRLDDETREILTGMADEIEEHLEASESDTASMRDRLEQAIYRFEADHPHIARILGEIGDTLAKLGI